MNEVSKHLASILLSGRGGVLPTVAEQQKMEELHKSGVSVENAAIAAAVAGEVDTSLLHLFNVEFSEEPDRGSKDS